METENVVQRLSRMAGSEAALSRLIGVHYCTVRYWRINHGRVPAQYHERVRAAARRMVFDEDEVEACLVGAQG